MACVALAWLLALMTPISHALKIAGLRVNRALRATHSRREANRLIEAGRLLVNGEVVTNPDSRLLAGDRVEFQGRMVAWEESELGPHRYIKLHKPRGVECTTAAHVPNNILNALAAGDGHRETAVNSSAGRRVYPIGRLDTESTGLILLTSNGDIVNPLLRASDGKRKEYEVVTSPRATDGDVTRLSQGVVITTMARRSGIAQEVTAPTRPCIVERKDGNTLRFVLQEGRNRQVRRMCAAVGLEVTSLHRVGFSGVTLDGIEAEGTWLELSAEEELAIGARLPPTRDEQRTPEERARRKARKEERREARQAERESDLERGLSSSATAQAKSAARKLKGTERAAKAKAPKKKASRARRPQMSSLLDDERRAAHNSHALALEHSERTYHGGMPQTQEASIPCETARWDRYTFPGMGCSSRLGVDATAPAGFDENELARVSRVPVLSGAQCSAIIDEAEKLSAWEESGRIAHYARQAGCLTPLRALPQSCAMLAPFLTSVLFPAIKEVRGKTTLPLTWSSCPPVSARSRPSQAFPCGCRTASLRVSDARLVKYNASALQTELGLHRDGPLMTASIALNSLADYDGGGTLIEALTCTEDGSQDLQGNGHNCALRVERGHAVVHPGCIRHGGERITRGLRYVLILFLFDASNVDHDRYCLLRANVSKPCEETRPWRC